MSYRHDAVPTKDMLLINAPLTQEEMDAVQRLQQAKETCKRLRTAAGLRTSATEDIMESRRAKLRYGLFKGEIPFGVYNYGIAQSLRKEAQFQASADESFEVGKKMGQEKAMAEFNQLQTQMQINSLNNQMMYNNYMSSTRTWNCSASHSFGDYYSVSCY
ncbi:hypothetical protein [Magnetospira sp. QH-2]|uniref:hypothetical protein n=1 Tax=Magnetospira sp. (strain QH-2) TaxID=1288970 RepID=UPI0011DD9EFE|nr:hypothetical protein [Magnetospira sp. QH-2]